MVTEIYCPVVLKFLRSKLPPSVVFTCNIYFISLVAMPYKPISATFLSIVRSVKQN
jgi:hypothetical protein